VSTYSMSQQYKHGYNLCTLYGHIRSTCLIHSVIGNTLCSNKRDPCIHTGSVIFVILGFLYTICSHTLAEYHFLVVKCIRCIEVSILLRMSSSMRSNVTPCRGFPAIASLSFSGILRCPNRVRCP